MNPVHLSLTIFAIVAFCDKRLATGTTLPHDKAIEALCTDECSDILSYCINLRECDSIITDPDDEAKEQRVKDEERSQCLEGCWTYADTCHLHCIERHRQPHA
ncbi:hypothetical protein BaRGS_00022276 [Batillaria attramentaria]|uniref:Uncharacterized protein n=1 Tax=Batillaria attramentaria TaxID=370345 RepID=A0ABD0KHJ7_9CAEN|nr:hypothetical protein BaRGS_000500 [Batillaria attramentaria]